MEEASTKEKNLIFTFGLLLFLIAACLGYVKLPYGFNFIDEGYHMTRGWRLTVGDHFLDNKHAGPLMLYPLFNSLIFKINPNVTLLGFREIQYALTLVAIFMLGFSLYRFHAQYWHLPYFFCIFAFTGLDATGMISNLNYYTWPHFFITLALAFFILGLKTQKIFYKSLLYIISGVFCFCLSLSLLHLSVVILFPIILFLINRRLKFKEISFTFRDMCCVTFPFLMGWSLFLMAYNKAYITVLLHSLTFALSSKSHSVDALLKVNWKVMQRIGIVGVYWLSCWALFTKCRMMVAFPLVAILSGGMYLTIDTSLFGMIGPYYRGWFNGQIWFSALMTSFLIIFWTTMLVKYIRGMPYKKGEGLGVVILIPISILALTSTIFSGLGALTVLHLSIPFIAVVASLCGYQLLKLPRLKMLLKLIMIFVFLSPFYYFLGLADWECTYFDLPPKNLDWTIKDGFGKGIKTNSLYGKLYEWIQFNADVFSAKDDYMLSYVVSPMTHMITKMRPSFDDTFITFKDLSSAGYAEAVEEMKQQGREPSIAFVFERMPILVPVPLEKGIYGWLQKQFDFTSSSDAISVYVRNHMQQVDEFIISEKDSNIIRCFVHNDLLPNFKHASGQ